MRLSIRSFSPTAQSVHMVCKLVEVSNMDETILSVAMAFMKLTLA